MGSTSTMAYDLLIVTDATYSMGEYLTALNSSLPEIIGMSTLTAAFERIGIVAYHDYCDAEVVRWLGWYTLPSASAATLAASANDPSAVTQDELMDRARELRPDGGGDYPEAAKSGLAQAYNVMRAEAITMILVYADAPPHFPLAQGVNWTMEEAALNAERYGPHSALFIDWRRAAKTLKTGGPEERKAVVVSFPGNKYPQTATPWMFLSAVTKGVCLVPAKLQEKALAQLTVNLLLAWMGHASEGGTPVAEVLEYAETEDAPSESALLTGKLVFPHGGKKNLKAVTKNMTSKTLSTKDMPEYIPARLGEPVDLVKRYQSDAAYADLVREQLRRVIATDVVSLTVNPVFGMLWRAVASNRNSSARDELLDLFSTEIAKARKTEAAAETTGPSLAAWLDASYDFSAEIEGEMKKVAKDDLFPCLFLDPTLDFSSDGDVPINEFTREELLEIGRSCDPRVLSRLAKVLTRLTCIDSAAEMPAHIDDSVPRLPLALGTKKHNHRLWSYIPHLVLGGTRLSSRGAALLAALALRSGIAPLRKYADAELVRFPNWDDLEVPETWSTACLGLLLDADAEYERRVASGERPRLPKNGSARRSVLTDTERKLFRSLVTYKTLERNLRTTLTARVSWRPNKDLAPIGLLATCTSCKLPRSVSIMNRGVCGLCYEDMCGCPGCMNVPHIDEMRGSCVSPDHTPLTPATWVECGVQTCRAQYVVYNPQRLNIRPKCYHCRHGATFAPKDVPWVQCSTCTNRVIVPKQYRQSGPWQCYACDGGLATIVEVETDGNALRKENGTAWLVKSTIADSALFDGRSLHYTATTVGKDVTTVQILPPSDTPLTLRARHIHNSGEVKEQLRGWVESRRVELGTCSLCASDMAKNALHAACGRRGCDQLICHPCRVGWYGLNAAGRVVNTAALFCPFCRRLPAPRKVSEFGTARVAFLRTAAEDRAWVYAWCRTCVAARRYVARECARGAPRVEAWECEECEIAAEERAAAEAATRDALEVAAAHDFEAAQRIATAWEREDATQARTLERAHQYAAGIKECPACTMRTKKNGGCLHMTCICREHWCWECEHLGKDEDDVYRHIRREHGGIFGDEDEGEW